MTPLEINKKIAGLKCGIGERGVSASIGDYGRPTNRVTYFLEVDGNVRVNSRFFNWAESISDAWELFEEMPGAELKHDDNTEDGKDFYYCIEKKTNQHIYGDTAPLAICNAWLAWMESKK